MEKEGCSCADHEIRRDYRFVKFEGGFFFFVVWRGGVFLVDYFYLLVLEQREPKTQYKIFTCKCVPLKHNHLVVQSDFYKYCIRSAHLSAP